MRESSIILKAVAPFVYPKGVNYKGGFYKAWINNGGKTAASHYPGKLFRKFVFQNEFPRFDLIGCCLKCNKEARLRLVDPLSINLEAFPDYMFYEIVPVIWDCWPMFYDKMTLWFERHCVKTAIFTSSQTADAFKQRIPQLNVLWCPEAITTTSYKTGERLADRSIDVLEFGRHSGLISSHNSSFNVVETKRNNKFLYTPEELCDLLQNSKIAITLPRSITQPDVACGVETLTQRYWECMLSRCVMIGHCPEELKKIIGYNPVIEIQRGSTSNNEIIMSIIANIADYQDLVDKNRETALMMGDWDVRMIQVQKWLVAQGYSI